MSIQNSLTIKLRRAFLSAHRAGQKVVASSGVTLDQFILLTLLLEEDQIRQTVLAQRAAADPATLTAMIKILERKKYIKKTIDKTDSRARLIKITATGKRLQTRLAKKIKPVDDTINKSFTKKDLKAMLTALDLISEAANQTL